MSDIPIDMLVEKVMAELQKRVEQKLPGEAIEARNEAANGISNHGVNRTATDSAREMTGAKTDESETSDPESWVPTPKDREGLADLVASTPARIGVWRTGTRPLTKTMLQFRCDHAAAVDAVYGEVDPKILNEFHLFTVETTFENTENYLKRPDRGRILTDEAAAKLKARCMEKPQVQIVVSDGLSASAIDANLPDVLPALLDSLKAHKLSSGTPFFVRGGRVASMDHIGEVLKPDVLVLLIGERPGLVSANSMSAYMCYKPRRGTVESDRTVISNIHKGGTPPVEAGAHIGTIVKKMLEQKTSGVNLVI